MKYHVQTDLIERLKSEMQDHQVTQTRLSNEVGISRKHLTRVLAGKAQASVRLWQRLLDAAAEYQGAPDMSTNGRKSDVQEH